MPIVVASWKPIFNAPRNRYGDISEMYIGTACMHTIYSTVIPCMISVMNANAQTTSENWQPGIDAKEGSEHT